MLLRRARFLRWSICWLLVFVATTVAQELLTNNDVATLIRSGLAHEKIVVILKSTPGDYDTSAAALQKLKDAGASMTVIEALQAPERRFEATAPAMTAAPRVLSGISLPPETCGDDAGSMEDCHANYKGGCSKSQHPRYDAYLNFLKNQTPNPDVEPVKFLTKDDLDALESEIVGSDDADRLTENNHADHAAELAALGERKIHAVIGYLYYAYPTGKETCNCQLSGERAVDFHMGIGFTKPSTGELKTLRSVASYLHDRPGHTFKNKDPEKDKLRAFEPLSFVVEMTPHYRARFRPGWTAPRLDDAVGMQVKVVGQLMADNAHANGSDDCGYPNSDTTCWRASIWELHPVTAFFVCTSSTPCTENSAAWIRLEDQP